MYPAETSLVPATVSLLRFFETRGLAAFGQSYPYWYAGTTPYKYLIGPVVPIFTHILRLIPRLSGVSLFTIMIYIIIFCFLLSAVGWGILMYQVSKTKSTFLAGCCILVFLLFPWRLFSALTLEEASFTLARFFLPFALLSFWALLVKKTTIKYILTAVTISFLLLINTSILPIVLVGLVSLSSAYSYKKGKIKSFFKNLKLVIYLTAASVVLVSLWYTPDYWITILFNPSIGGISTIRVFAKIFEFARSVLPIVAALFAVRLFSRLKSKLDIFISVWLGTFAIITIYRFLADPDFWMDWTAWFSEIEVGMIFLFCRLVQDSISQKSLTLKKALVILLLFLTPLLLCVRVYIALGRPKILSRETPSFISMLSEVEKQASTKRVFLSGSSVFWADAFYDIYQLRGGRDQVATDADWARAAWVFRESRNLEEIKSWLDKCDISYVLVNGEKSSDYYHDFKNSDLWGSLGSEVIKRDGDILYQIKTSE
jgi:hypothetical protein